MWKIVLNLVLVTEFGCQQIRYKMKTTVLTILLLTVLWKPNLNACTCARFDPVFCHNVSETSNVIRVHVLEFVEFYLMRVELLENLHQEINSDTITILGQDGLNCGEILGGFTPGDTLILALRNWWEIDGEVYWYLDGCGRHYLSIQNEDVVGPITPFINQQTLDDFKDNLFDCFEMISSVDESEISSEIKVFPNPFNGTLNIVSDHVKIESIDVFDFTGKLVERFEGRAGTDVELSISMRKAGVYLFVFSTNKGVFREKVVCVLD